MICRRRSTGSTEAGERRGRRKATAFPWHALAGTACALLGTASGALAQGTPAECVAPGSSLRLDHVPVAAGDLEALSRRLTDEFGFRVQDGGRDENGLHNAEIRFGDGTRLELRTVAGPGDPEASGADEARRYADLIADGGGGAYAGHGLGAVTRQLAGGAVCELLVEGEQGVVGRLWRTADRVAHLRPIVARRRKRLRCVYSCAISRSPRPPG